MATRNDDSTVPSWDGQAKNWRRYTKEVAWFVASTPTKKRRYVASKLISRLSGPARLLAMSWSRTEFDSPDGTLNLLKKLAALLWFARPFRIQLQFFNNIWDLRDKLVNQWQISWSVKRWVMKSSLKPSYVYGRNRPVLTRLKEILVRHLFQNGIGGMVTTGIGGMEPASGDSERQQDPAATTAAAARC